MILTKEEFKLLRPFNWTYRTYNSKIYNTIIGETQTRLFWLDFYRLIFAPKYAKQSGITSINDVDLTKPVLLSNELELIVSPELDAVAYFVDNADSPPIKFSTGLTQMPVLIVACVLLFILLIVTLIFSSRTPFLTKQFI